MKGNGVAQLVLVFFLGFKSSQRLSLLMSYFGFYNQIVMELQMGLAKHSNAYH